jgi:hypothetical protein
VRGRPSCTPCAFVTASASFVRWPINLRSNWEKFATELAIISLAGVVVSSE